MSCCVNLLSFPKVDPVGNCPGVCEDSGTKSDFRGELEPLLFDCVTNVSVITLIASSAAVLGSLGYMLAATADTVS